MVAEWRSPALRPSGSDLLGAFERWGAALFDTGTGGIPFAIWSADGRRILYWHYAHADVVVGEIDGEQRRALGAIPAGEEVSGLSLTADGRRLILSKGPYGGNMNLWEVELDPETSLPRSPLRNVLMTSTPDLQIAVSSDGQRIAFTEQHIQRHLYRIDFDPLTARPRGEPRCLTHHSPTNLYPSLSPDGATLVWTAQGTGQGLLYGRRLADETERKLTPAWGGATREVEATIADSGEVIYSATMEGSYELWRLPAPGSVPLRLSDTEYPYSDSAPAWCRGLGVVFEALHPGLESVDLWRIEDAGAAPEPLVTNPGSQETFPSCNAAGSRIALRSDRRGSQDLWVYEVESKETRPLEIHPAEEAWAAWSPDDRWLFFTSNRSGAFNLWVKPLAGGYASPFTRYRSAIFGLPEIGLFTKFAVGRDFVILPLESRTGEIYVLELGEQSGPESS